jgi:flagellar basal-body rod protein FlgB
VQTLFFVLNYKLHFLFADYLLRRQKGLCMNDFSRSVDLLQREMDVTSLRYQVSSNNLANSGVPNFKRTTVNFESELKKAFDSEENCKNGLHLTTTDNRHIQINVPYDYKDVQPRRVLDYTTTAKANGNNVDAETEANNILQIQMQYRMLTQLTSFEFDQINTAIKK